MYVEPRVADGRVEESVRLGVELVAEVVVALPGTETPEHAANKRSQKRMAIRAAPWRKMARFECLLSAEPGKRQDID
jgi:hypothetical protein